MRGIVALCLLLGLSGPVAGFQEGIYFVTWQEGSYSRATARASLEELRDTGAEWVAIISPHFQQHAGSTEIFRAGTDLNTGRERSAPSEEDLTQVVRWAHELGLKVMLVPHVMVLHPDQWKGQIRFDEEAGWSAWFSAYRELLVGQARLAERLGVAQLSLGNELRDTSHREGDWRALISAVRGAYSGRLVYAAHHDEVYRIAWWDALDAIGIDAYWDLVDSDSPSVEEIQRAWRPHAAELERLAKRWNKQVIFTEVGFRSVDGAVRKPWSFAPSSEVDSQEQADAYRATLQQFFHEPWVGGFYWWAWDVEPSGGQDDPGYTPRGKPAEDVLRSYYGGERAAEGYGWIYRDGYQGGWTSESWRASIDAAAGEGRYDSASIRADLDSLGGLSFVHGGGEVSGYRALELWYRGPQVDLGVSVETSHREHGTILLAHRVSEEGGWTRVVVPLEDLGPGRVRIHVQDLSGSGASFQVDEVRLLEQAPSEPERGPDVVAVLAAAFEQLGRALGLGGGGASPRVGSPAEPREAEGLLGALGRAR